MAKKQSAKKAAPKKAAPKKSKSNKSSAKQISVLEERHDLFKKWIIKNWFTTQIEIKYLNKVFLELFMSLYDDLTSKFNDKKRDDLFVNFTNVVFPTVLDVYKWHESEKAMKDIGLVKALEEICLCDWYIELLTSYSSQYDSK